MARRRGSHVGRRRALDQAARFGEEVRVARATLGLSREQAARQAGVSWSTQRRVEVGDPAVSLDTACSVASAVGLDTVLRVYPGRPPGLRDTGQLELAEQLRSAAHPSLISALEQPAGSHAESADLLFLGATEILHHEIERLVTDFQAQYRRALRKREAMAAQHSRPVRLVWTVEDTQRNRASLEAHLELIRLALPAGSREIMRSIRGGQPLGRDGLLWVRRPPKPAPSRPSPA